MLFVRSLHTKYSKFTCCSKRQQIVAQMLSQRIEKHEQNKDCVLTRLVTTKPLCYLPVDDSFLNAEKRYMSCQFYIRERALTIDSYLFASKENPHRNAISVNWKSKVGTDTFRWNKWQKRNAKLNILLSRRCIWFVC